MTHNTQWRGKLDALLDAFNERHASVGKGISHSTRQARSQGLYRIFALLRKLGFKPVPENLAERHVRALMAYWTAQPVPADVLLDMPMSIPRRAYPCSAAYIQQQMSFIRVFASWIGKPGLVRSAESYVSDPALVRRSYGALIDKGCASQLFNAMRMRRLPDHRRRISQSRAVLRAVRQFTGEGYAARCLDVEAASRCSW